MYKPDLNAQAQFNEQLNRIVNAAGGIKDAAAAMDVTTKTIGRWLNSPPKRNWGQTLVRADELGERLFPGTYPVGAGGDKTLHELAFGVPAAHESECADDSAKAETAPSSKVRRDGGDDARQRRDRASHGLLQLLGVSVACALLVSLGVVVVWRALDTGSNVKGSAVAATGEPSSAGGRFVPGTLPAKPGLMVEVSAGKSGVPVYGSSSGGTVPDAVRQRIPYGTAVYVKCKEPNRSGMTSVAWFYRLVDGEWDGMSAVSNGFQNGDEFGISGGHVVNEAIPTCP